MWDMVAGHGEEACAVEGCGMGIGKERKGWVARFADCVMRYLGYVRCEDHGDVLKTGAMRTRRAGLCCEVLSFLPA